MILCPGCNTMKNVQPGRSICEACRKRAHRAAKEGTPAEKTQDKTIMTKTDRAFDDDYPNYYIFDGELADRKCEVCSKPFKTRLTLLSYCSPACQQKMIAALSGHK